MHSPLRRLSGKAVAIAVLAFAFVFVAGTAVASLTFSTNTIAGDSAISLNPTGQPVTVNGDLTVTGTCTGCGTGGAPASATYVTQTPNGSLSGEQALSTLATGLLNVTTTTGVLTSLAPTDDRLLLGNGTAWQLTALTDCQGSGKAVTYTASSNLFGCNTISSGGTPGGSTTQIQFNDGGSFGGDSGLVFNKTTGALTIGAVLQGNGNVLSTPADTSGVSGNSARNECNQTLTNGGLAMNWVLATNVGGVRHEVLCVDANGDLVFPRMVYYQTMGPLGAPFPQGFNPTANGGQMNQYTVQGDHFAWYVLNSDAGVGTPMMQLYTGASLGGQPALRLWDVLDSTHGHFDIQPGANGEMFIKPGNATNRSKYLHQEAGACTLSSGSCTFTFAAAYNAAPFCTVSPTTTGTFTTGSALKVAPGTGSVIVSDTTSGDTAVVNILCSGI